MLHYYARTLDTRTYVLHAMHGLECWMTRRQMTFNLFVRCLGAKNACMHVFHHARELELAPCVDPNLDHSLIVFQHDGSRVQKWVVR